MLYFGDPSRWLAWQVCIETYIHKSNVSLVNENSSLNDLLSCEAHVHVIPAHDMYLHLLLGANNCNKAV